MNLKQPNKKPCMKDVVFEILRSFPLARDDDNMLLYYYLRFHLGWDIGHKEWRQLRDGISLDSLGRARRKLQNDEGTYLPTMAVYKERRKKEARARQTRGGNIIQDDTTTPEHEWW